METNHNGHRERKRQKFLKQGNLENFEEHEILELLLFYAIPRKNTNDIAHALIDKFGSLAKVFDADIEVLQEIDGISINSAIFIKLMPQMCKKYFNAEISPFAFNSTDDFIQFGIKQYIGETKEILRGLYLDSSNSYVSCDIFGDASNPTAVIMSVNRIIEKASKYDANHLVLYHNHPSGDCTPSTEDIMATKRLVQILNSLNITLIDHIIISKNLGLSMRKMGYMDK